MPKEQEEECLLLDSLLHAVHSSEMNTSERDNKMEPDVVL